MCFTGRSKLPMSRNASKAASQLWMSRASTYPVDRSVGIGEDLLLVGRFISHEGTQIHQSLRASNIHVPLKSVGHGVQIYVMPIAGKLHA